MGTAKDGVSYETVTYWRKVIPAPANPDAIRSAVDEATAAVTRSGGDVGPDNPVQVDVIGASLRVSVVIKRETSDVLPGSRGAAPRAADATR